MTVTLCVTVSLTLAVTVMVWEGHMQVELGSGAIEAETSTLQYKRRKQIHMLAVVRERAYVRVCCTWVSACVRQM